MNAGETREIFRDHLFHAVQLEHQIQSLKTQEASIQSIIGTAQESDQGNDTVQIDDYSRRLALVKEKLKKFESQQQSHLETLSKCQELSYSVFQEFSVDGPQSILTWHNNLLTLWNDTKEGESSLRSHEIRFRDLLTKLDNLTSLIHEESKLKFEHWQKPTLVFLRDLVQVTRRLKNAHNLKFEMASAMDPSLDLRLAQVTEQIEEVERRFTACCAEVEEVKEAVADLKTATFADECVRATVATLMPALVDPFSKNMRNFLVSMDEHCNSHIQKIKVATDLSGCQLDELRNGIAISPMQPEGGPNNATEH